MTQTIRISKQNNDVLTSTDYNDYIFNSDLNTFKILQSGTVLANVNSGTTTVSIAHNQGTWPSFYAFAKFPDGYVALPSEKERTDGFPLQRKWEAEADSGSVHFIFTKGTSANFVSTVSYFIFDAPINGNSYGTILSDTGIKTSKEGKDVLTSYKPDDFTYSSDYNTLKYYSSGTKQVVVSGSDISSTVPHNLGYVPYFDGMINNFVFANPALYNHCPGGIALGTLYTYMGVYADTANLYLDVQTNAASGTWTFRYFIFRNNLGL